MIQQCVPWVQLGVAVGLLWLALAPPRPEDPKTRPAAPKRKTPAKRRRRAGR